MQLLACCKQIPFCCTGVTYAERLLLANEGNGDEAVRTALLMFRLAHHFDRNPTLISFFVAIAVRNMAIEPANLALQTGPVSKPIRDALDAELAIQERMEGYGWAIKSERAFVLDSFRDIVPCRNFWLISRGLLESAGVCVPGRISGISRADARLKPVPSG